MWLFNFVKVLVYLHTEKFVSEITAGFRRPQLNHGVECSWVGRFLLERSNYTLLGYVSVCCYEWIKWRLLRILCCYVHVTVSNGQKYQHKIRSSLTSSEFQAYKFQNTQFSRRKVSFQTVHAQYRVVLGKAKFWVYRKGLYLVNKSQVQWQCMVI
jgi:hypothetical protein